MQLSCDPASSIYGTGNSTNRGYFRGQHSTAKHISPRFLSKNAIWLIWYEDYLCGCISKSTRKHGNLTNLHRPG
jgi:hypothetical protein